MKSRNPRGLDQGTPEGDAYTLSEIEEMLKRAGFELTDSFALPPVATGIVGQKR